jgi:Neutral/alkaline non-lysosomal ceramidase, N-terminal
MNAGAAEIDITPDFAVDLSGFALRTQPSTGVLESIFARALYLADGGEKLLWIACDVVALERDFVERFRAWARAQLKLEPRQVLLSATHTHSAPATIHLSACGEYSERYVGLLAGKVREVARRAVAKARPCEVVAGSSTLDLAVDRRNKPSSHVDPTVWCVAFRPAGSRAFVAAVLNYTMHPVSLGHTQRGISPDWCGAASRALSQSLAGKPVALVSNGAAGNINPPALEQEPDVVRGWGELVGAAAFRAIESAKPQAEGAMTTLRVRSDVVPVPLETHSSDEIDRIADDYIHRMKDFVWGEPFRVALENWRVAMKGAVARGAGDTVPIEIQAIRIGGGDGNGVTIVTVNGEIFTRFTDHVRRETTPNLFTVAYANAAFGYIPTREAYAEGGYEVDTAHFFYNSFRPKPGGLEFLAERAIELVRSLDV